jgi:hypothetical protein
MFYWYRRAIEVTSGKDMTEKADNGRFDEEAFKQSEKRLYARLKKISREGSISG